MLQDITSRTVSFNDLTEINRKRLLLTTISFLIVVFGYGLIVNIVITNSLWAIIGFSISLIAAIGVFLYYLLSKNSRLTATITVLVLVFSFLAYLEISISAIFALFFFPITIIITFYLMGRRAGLIIAALVFASTITYLVVRQGVWGNVVFDANAFANFVISAVASIALILLYEITLVDAYVKLIHSNKMLETMSVTDALTGLNNRKWIDVELAQRLENARKGRGFAVFVIDFDDFKQINDEFGHIAGDQALQSFADLMRTGVNYKVGRWGGEEFICFCDSNTVDKALVCAEKLCRLVADSVLYANKKITISVGVAVYQPGDTAVTILNRADKGVYQAKAEGKNRVCHIEPKTIRKTK